MASTDLVRDDIEHAVVLEDIPADTAVESTGFESTGFETTGSQSTEPEDAVSTKRDRSSRRRAPRKQRGRRSQLLAYVVLVALLAGAIAWFVIELGQPDRRHAPTGDGAVAAAGAQAKALMDLDYRTAKADLQRVVDGSTGDMRDSYSKAMAATIATTSSEKSVSTGAIRSVALSSFSGTKAEVLVAGDATVAFPKTASAAASKIQVRYRFRVEMQYIGGVWKSTQLNFAGPAFVLAGGIMTMTTDTMSTDTMTTDTLTTEAADVTATVIDHPETVGSSGRHRSGKPGKPAKAPKAPRASKAPKAFRASETPEATKAPKPAKERRRLGWLRVLVLPVVALLTIGFFVAALVMHLTNKTPAQRAPLNTETRAAIAKANADVKDILSYDYRSLNSDISSAKADLTGQLLTDYTASASKILAQAPPIKAIVTATVSAQAVESADTNRVTLLMYIDQESVKQLKGQKTPSTRIDPLRVRMTMTKVNGAWKASNLEPL